MTWILSSKSIKRYVLLVVVIVNVRVLIGQSRLDFLKNGIESINVFNLEVDDEYGGSNDVGDPPKIEGEQNKPTLRNPDLLLNVPFYVYEDEFLNDIQIWNITKMFKMYEGYVDKTFHSKLSSTNSTNGNVTFLEFAETFKYFKHCGDVNFISSALRHPMRVLNPENAKIFVVPSLLTYDVRNLLYHKSKKVMFHTRKRLDKMNKVLETSPWFQRNDGADHIAPVAPFQARGVLRMFPLLARCNLIQYWETSTDPNYILPTYQQNRTMFKIFKVGAPCRSVKSFQKTRDYAFIGRLGHRKKRMDRWYQDRRDICNWMSTTNYSSSVCGLGDQCPHLSQSLLGFHIRGDSISANRLFDTLLSGTVPVFTRKKQYGAQPEWYDWDKISYFANVENKTHFVDGVNKILSNKTDIMMKTNNVFDNKDLFDWQTIVPFDVYMYQLQAKIFPKTRVTSSKYSALILPK